MRESIRGYCDRISVKAGDPINFMISSPELTRASVELVKLIHGDAQEGGPGFVEERVPSDLPREIPLAHQYTQVGSFATAEDPGHDLSLANGGSIAGYIWPTIPQRGVVQAIYSKWDDSRKLGYELQISQDGHLTFIWGDGFTYSEIKSAAPLIARCWYLVGVAIDPRKNEVTLYQDEVINSYNSIYSKALENSYRSITRKFSEIVLVENKKAPFVFAATCNQSEETGRRFEHLYNGKIDRTILFSSALTEGEFDALKGGVKIGTERQNGILAYWDTSQGYGEKGIDDTIIDLGPFKVNAVGYNRPVRGMTGYNWNGRDDSYRISPQQYGGIHFHEDALIDCKWAPTIQWLVPKDLKSACYALKLTSNDVEEYIPFFVRAAEPKAKVAVLMATASYLAYANEQLALNVPVVQPIFGRTPILSEDDLVRVDNGELGLSTYDTHLDGAGVCFTSYRRPILNMRPKYRMSVGCTWQFPADLSIIAWLENQDIDYEILTDEDLHREGSKCLNPYKLVISSSHPEYYSEKMLDATEDYLGAGGRVIYTGANGYYWVVSFRDDEPWCMEVRKLESGSRAWQAMPGEYYNQTEPVKSGLWRNRGRAPQKLVGVGFSTEGFDASGAYSILSDAKSEDGAWIFEGVKEAPVFGNFGLALGGAAGIEMDRYDLYLGTPPQALLLATSQGHSDNYPRVSEEIYYNFPGQGATQDYQCRADMVYFKTRNDGAVFSTGSIAWASALPINNFDNSVSRIMRNVVDEFVK